MKRRFIIKAIEEAIKDTPVNLIIGPRQVGKSTLCDQLIEEGLFKGQVVTMDDTAILQGAKNDPLGFLKSLDKHVIIDEVQRVPELILSIKKLVDEDRKGVRIVLTGSANVMLLPKVADSLAGRIEIHNVWPMSQTELHEKPSEFLSTLLSGSLRFKTEKTDWETLVKLITIGGFPEAVSRPLESRRKKWFASYIKSILQKDVKDLSNIEGLTDIPKVLHLIATRAGSRINFSEIGRLADIKTPTLHRYLALLENIFLVVKIPAWTPNEEGQYVKSPKVYLNDTGLLTYLRGEGKDSLLSNRTTFGSFVENFVVMEIMKQITWFDAELKPYHFSIHKGAEVDLVLEDDKKQLYGIEIKSKASVDTDDFKGLKKLAETAGKKFRRGLVLYSGDHVVGGFGEHMQAVPLSALWA
jgi:predicted AAA+ superfamily ATPase